MAQQPILTEEERKRLDRQRFIGVQTQKRLLAFRVFITPANGINSQLAKNLTLAGVNVTIFDDAIITEEDFQTNFLIPKSQIGKKRGEVVSEKLRGMNPTGKNQWVDQNPSNDFSKYTQEFLKRFTILVTSQKSFEIVSRWDQITKKANIPYYNQLGCGLFSFAYISLGSHYQFKEINKKDKQVSKIWNISSLGLKECLSESNLNKSKQSTFLTAVIMMQKAQSEGLKYDPLLESQDAQKIGQNQSNLNKIVDMGTKVREGNQKNQRFLRKFATTFGIDYCPVYSVVGSIISQEIIKIAENQFEPGINWLFYDSQQGFGSVFKLKSQNEFIKSRVPE